MKTKAIVIIGAGIVGCSTVYHLAKHTALGTQVMVKYFAQRYTATVARDPQIV